jgi:GT2 family glycosyltransferase
VSQVGIVIPSYQDRPFLERCLDSLWLNTPLGLFSLLVINDGSTDGTGEWILEKSRQYQFYTITTPNIRFTRVCNEGLRWMHQHIPSDWYLLLNSDTLLTPNWLQEMIVTGERMQAAIVGCKLLLGSGLIHHAGAYGDGYHYGDHQPNSRFWEERYVPWVTGALMMIRQDCYATLGGLEPGPPGEQYDASDREYIKRAWQRGFPCAFSPAVVYHLTEEAMRVRKGE